MADEHFQDISSNGHTVTSDACALVNLFCVLEACGKNLAIRAVVFKLVYDLCNHLTAVADDVVKAVNVGSYEIRTCHSSHKSLSGGKDRGHGDTNADFLEHHGSLETLFADRDLYKEGAAKSFLEKLCFLNDLLCLFLGGLDMEHLVGTDDASDLLNERPEIGICLGDNRGVGGNACQGIEFVTMFDCRKICGVENVDHVL